MQARPCERLCRAVGLCPHREGFQIVIAKISHMCHIFAMTIAKPGTRPCQSRGRSSPASLDSSPVAT